MKQSDLFNDINIATNPESEGLNSGVGKPRLVHAQRHQMEVNIAVLDDIISDDHKAKLVWNFVSKLDLSKYLKNIKSVEGASGRPAIDPKVLVSIWLYATIEGIASANTVGRYCREHHGFLWICGNTNIGRKTLSNFRADQGELLDDLLAQSVAIMQHKGFIDLSDVGQDGMRVRAHAGSSSFKTLKTLKQKYKVAKKFIKELKEELKKNPNGPQQRREQEKLRRANEKEEMLKKAIDEMAILKRERNTNRKRNKKKPLSKKEEGNLRVSMTDPCARTMKMGDSGFRPAYNMQFVTTVKGQAILSVGVTNQGTDSQQLAPMFDKVLEKYNTTPENWLADCGFKNQSAIEKVENEGCKVYIPPQDSGKTDPYLPKKGESKIIEDWRRRMGTEDGKTKYKLRSQTAEFPNAEARNRGVKQFLVRGIEKTLNVGLIFALTYNFMRFNCMEG